MSTTKSGWLEKFSGTIFKSWKRKYCVLYTDGEFSVYDEPNQATAHLRIQMRNDCKQIDVGFACGSINLPKGQSSVDSLFCIKTRQGKEYNFAAASDRECNEWVGMLEHARNANISNSKTVPQAPLASQPVYQQNVQGGPPPPYSVNPNQPTGYAYPQQQVVYQPAPVYGQPVYGPQPMYGQPMYGQPMYGQPMYVQGPPPSQQSSNNSTRNMMLGAAGGGLAGFALGSMMAGGMHGGFGHHDHWDHHGSFDDGGFDCGGGDFDF